MKERRIGVIHGGGGPYSGKGDQGQELCEAGRYVKFMRNPLYRRIGYKG